MAIPRLKMESRADGVDRRSIPRVDVRQSDGVNCKVTSEGQTLFVGQPYDVSMNSVALIVQSNIVDLFLAQERFEFELEIPDHGSFNFNARLMSVRDKGESNKKLAFTFERPLALASNEPEVDGSGIFSFPPNYSVNAFMYKPNFFYERSFVKLKSLGNKRIVFDLFDFETLVFPGMRIELFAFDAGFQLPPMLVQVEELTTLDKKVLEVRAKILSFPKKLSTKFAQALIFDFQMSLEAVRALGLAVPKISDGLRFRVVKTAEEYADVLKLRLKAYQLAGKVADGKTHLDMVATLDHLSRIVVAYHGDRIVASIAVSFPDSNDLVLDTEKAFANGYPKKIPPKVEGVEIARLCTDPEYRGSDLLLRLFEHTYKTLQCGGRKFMISSTDARLWPLYKKMGFKKTGMQYPHPYLSGIIHYVIIAHLELAQNGAWIDPFRWNYLYRDMNNHLKRRGVFKHNFVQQAWLAGFTWIGKILKIKTKKTL